MRKGIIVDVSAADRIRLEAVVVGGNSPRNMFGAHGSPC
jgi:hypothetical protein